MINLEYIFKKILGFITRCCSYYKIRANAIYQYMQTFEKTSGTCISDYRQLLHSSTRIKGM